MVISLLVRAGIVVGAVYYSKKLGVWGSSEETEKLYNELKEGLRPHAKELEKKLPFDVPALPQTGEARFLAKHYYNEGVKKTFHFIEMLPCYTGQLIHKAKVEFERFSQPPSSSTDK
ncbi:PREDICTED: MICOS complex subunit MIC13 homolog QIL1-like [Rhagoletis zephyria]|uniref:MICOS complex subunit MIC13 homolog QIL1-like n=1 Tax=Rhagoletis zephyria TaxID=28612 RepID=UPI0008115F14|nr:PREDICTED: MICOS complex subunit MIC13 homolog QIL1-like [Rhagoletis zephyria]XP_036337167.1 MICOS complex subunit MIC13 homolog QIL1-like [Rhagoletis pomonella]XP_036337168.1 MICOS complex subunit MIC13 homolog QIL1-like [Rhagoletis pomonella]